MNSGLGWIVAVLLGAGCVATSAVAMTPLTLVLLATAIVCEFSAFFQATKPYFSGLEIVLLPLFCCVPEARDFAIGLPLLLGLINTVAGREPRLSFWAETFPLALAMGLSLPFAGGGPWLQLVVAAVIWAVSRGFWQRSLRAIDPRRQTFFLQGSLIAVALAGVLLERREPLGLALALLIFWFQAEVREELKRRHSLQRLDELEQERDVYLRLKAKTEIEQISSTLNATQSLLQFKETHERLIFELAQTLFLNTELENAGHLITLACHRWIPCQTVAVFAVRARDLTTLKILSQAGSPTPQDPSNLYKAWREQHFILSSQGPVVFAGESSMLVLPLEEEGVVYLGRPAQSGFTPEEVYLARTISSLASMGLQSARRYEEYQRSQAGMFQSSKLAAVGQLAAGIAHELNTPLGAALLQLSMMEETREEPEAFAESYDTARKALKHLQQIISKLLYYSREGAVGEQRIDLNEVSRDTLQLLARQLEISEVKVHCRLAEEPLWVEANPNELQQVFTNLLINARDAVLLEGSRGRDLWVETRRNGANCEWSIVDQGPGVPAEIRERIFEPFFTSKEVGMGVGLGLFVSLQIANKAGGHLWLESPENGGARFILSLPCVVVPEAISNTFRGA